MFWLCLTKVVGEGGEAMVARVYLLNWRSPLAVIVNLLLFSRLFSLHLYKLGVYTLESCSLFFLGRDSLFYLRFAFCSCTSLSTCDCHSCGIVKLCRYLLVAWR